jgi:hypothetical protein
MKFSLEEINLLSEKLEKEKAQIYQEATQAQSENDIHHLETINYLQQRLEDQEAELFEEEKQYLASLIQDELHHIHGHGDEIYQSLLNKIT